MPFGTQLLRPGALALEVVVGGGVGVVVVLVVVVVVVLVWFMGKRGVSVQLQVSGGQLSLLHSSVHLWEDKTNIFTKSAVISQGLYYMVRCKIRHVVRLDKTNISRTKISNIYNCNDYFSVFHSGTAVQL